MSLLYRLLREWARIGLCFYTARVHIKRGTETTAPRPTILACNHPNSFLDAILLGVFHQRPVHFLARGDAFRKPWAAKILRSIGAIPIHRLSEGREHLHLNDEAFRECLAILKKGGTVLIFSEGLSEHGTGVRPLRKGTARLVWMAWQEGGMMDVVVQPVGLRYNSFSALPKQVCIGYAKPMRATDEWPVGNPAHFYAAFNEVLHSRLAECVSAPLGERRSSRANKRWFLLPLSAAGMLLQGPYYAACRSFVRWKTEGTVFYDSVLFGVLLLTYPVFVLLLTVAVVLITREPWAWMLLVGLPVTAWAMKGVMPAFRKE